MFLEAFCSCSLSVLVRRFCLALSASTFQFFALALSLLMAGPRTNVVSSPLFPTQHKNVESIENHAFFLDIQQETEYAF